MRHPINPDAPLMAQLRAIGLPESLPRGRAMVYRFFGEAEAPLYIGVTISPRGRWQHHKKRAAWWPLVRSVSVEWHPNERSSLDAEVAAIKAEMPSFNRRSSVAVFMSHACTPQTLLMSNVPLSLSRSLSRSLRSRNLTIHSQLQRAATRTATADLTSPTSRQWMAVI